METTPPQVTGDDTHTWVKHSEHGGYWQCPNDALDHYKALGWESSDPPREPNPALDERIAWLEAQRAEAAAAKAEETKPTKAARRGESRED